MWQHRRRWQRRSWRFTVPYSISVCSITATLPLQPDFRPVENRVDVIDRVQILRSYRYSSSATLRCSRAKPHPGWGFTGFQRWVVLVECHGVTRRSVVGNGGILTNPVMPSHQRGQRRGNLRIPDVARHTCRPVCRNNAIPVWKASRTWPAVAAKSIMLALFNTLRTWKPCDSSHVESFEISCGEAPKRAPNCAGSQPLVIFRALRCCWRSIRLSRSACCAGVRCSSRKRCEGFASSTAPRSRAAARSAADITLQGRPEHARQWAQPGAQAPRRRSEHLNSAHSLPPAGRGTQGSTTGTRSAAPWTWWWLGICKPSGFMSGLPGETV